MTTEEHLIYIGRITTAFAELEWLLDNLYVGLNCDFRNTDNEPTDFDSLSKRLSLIAFRIEKKYAERVKQWHDLEWEIRKLGKDRSRAVDSASEYAESPNVFIKREEPRTYSATDLAGLQKRIDEAATKVSHFIREIRVLRG